MDWMVSADEMRWIKGDGEDILYRRFGPSKGSHLCLLTESRVAISESRSMLHCTARCSMIFIAKHPDAEGP